MPFNGKLTDHSLLLYFVTDSTPDLLKGRDLPEVVEQAILGGVTMVQYRDKHSETKELVHMARRLHAVTKSHEVPLVVNDRVDVALAAGAEGCHIGQDDMDYETARALLGEKAIIGVSVSTADEAIAAAEAGADYLGIGTMFATKTKKDTKRILGIQGIRMIMDSLCTAGHFNVPCVAIGGINRTNIERVMFQSNGPNKLLNGVAVVSAIMSDGESPRTSATVLANLLSSDSPIFSRGDCDIGSYSEANDFLSAVPPVIAAVRRNKPLSHNMTNLVVQNFAANVALAIGASPIMANSGREATDLARLKGGLVINMGSVDESALENYIQAIQAYNAVGGHIVFDPVAAGATSLRRKAVENLMNSGYFAVIKGNESEIITVAGKSVVQQRGVDSGASETNETMKAEVVYTLSSKERNVVLMTGAVDYLSDGNVVLAISNGSPMLEEVTGAGCTLGTTISACLAAKPENPMFATLAGVLLFELAAERAASSKLTSGPGSFVPAFLDELSRISKLGDAVLCDGTDGPSLAKVRLVQGFSRKTDSMRKEH